MAARFWVVRLCPGRPCDWAPPVRPKQSRDLACRGRRLFAVLEKTKMPGGITRRALDWFQNEAQRQD